MFRLWSARPTRPASFRPRLTALEDRWVPYGYWDSFEVGPNGLTDPNVFFASIGAAQAEAEAQTEQVVQTYQAGYQQNHDRVTESLGGVQGRQGEVIADAGEALTENNRQLSAASQGMIDSLTKRFEAEGLSKAETQRKIQAILTDAGNSINALPPGTPPDSQPVQEIQRQARTIIATTLAQEEARSAEFARQVQSVQREYAALQGQFTRRQEQVIQAAVAEYQRLEATKQQIIDAWNQQNAALYNEALREYNAIAQQLAEKIRAAEQAISQARQAQADAAAAEAARQQQLFQQFQQQPQSQGGGASYDGGGGSDVGGGYAGGGIDQGVLDRLGGAGSHYGNMYIENYG